MRVNTKTLKDARKDMDMLREYAHELAAETHRIQPISPHEE